MPEYLSPGVYVEEIEIGAKPIEGVSTSTAGFLGETERGPTQPKLITGFTQYERLYGGYVWTTGIAATDEEKKAALKDQQGAEQAATTAADTLKQANRKAQTAATKAALPSATDADRTAADETKAAADKAKEESDAANRTAEAKAAQAKALSKPIQPSTSYLPYAIAGFFANGGQRCIVGRVAGQNASPAAVTLYGKDSGIDVTAVGPGIWGRRIWVVIQDASSAKAGDTTDKIFKLALYYWSGTPPAPGDGGKLPERAKLKDASGNAPIVEEFDDLSWDSRSPNFVLSRLHNQSHLIAVSAHKADPGAPPAATTQDVLQVLQGGTDGAEPDYQGATGQDSPTGLTAFEEKEDISIVCIPDQAKKELYPNLSDILRTHCERMKDRFAILQAQQDAGETDDLYPVVDSQYAAFYYPWIKIYDPATRMPKLIPPGGHIAGIYARSDIERGVFKAPANETVNGAIDLQFNITKGEQDDLNPRGVNCIRSFIGRGIRVWGARTTSDDPLWKYVNVRRLFIFLEKSIMHSTQWVVFEPNNEALWSRLKQGVSDWLTGVWRDGALMGTTPEEAFFVKCDRTTMTENDIENGKLVMLIGVAPTRPAEFVVFRLAQWRSGSAITE